MDAAAVTFTLLIFAVAAVARGLSRYYLSAPIAFVAAGAALSSSSPGQSSMPSCRYAWWPRSAWHWSCSLRWRTSSLMRSAPMDGSLPLAAVLAPLAGLAIGVAIGASGGWLLGWSVARELSSARTRGLGVLALAGLSFFSVIAHGLSAEPLAARYTAWVDRARPEAESRGAGVSVNYPERVSTTAVALTHAWS